MIKTLYRSQRGNFDAPWVLGRAKDGAISPRLANRYNRFALSHRPGYGYSFSSLGKVQRPERSQVPRPSSAWEGPLFYPLQTHWAWMTIMHLCAGD
jgi:hypothetical protein